MVTSDTLQADIQKAKALFLLPHLLSLQVGGNFLSLERVKIWLQDYVFNQGFANMTKKEVRFSLPIHAMGRKLELLESWVMHHVNDLIPYKSFGLPVLISPEFINRIYFNATIDIKIEIAPIKFILIYTVLTEITNVILIKVQHQ